MDTEVADVVGGILTAILQWKVKWLEEQKIYVPPPPICRTQPRKLKITYANYKDYESTFVPLLMYEIWAQIFEEWVKLQAELSGVSPMDVEDDGMITLSCNTRTAPGRPLCSTTRQTASIGPKQFCIGVLDYRSEGQFQCMLRCQSLVESNKVNSHLKLVNEGDLVLLDLVILEGQHDNNVCLPNNHGMTESALSLFAYVTDASPERITKHTMLAQCFLNVPSRNYHVVNYSCLIAKRPLRLKLNAPMKISGLYYLKPMIRQIEAVAILRESALASDILDPKAITCQLSIPTIVSINSPHYNDMQYKAIIGANEALVRNIPKIQLIQGPPGTGKTHTLIGIIKHFYLQWHEVSRMPKILICAPSNGAIDEVTKRLHKEREFLRRGPAKRSLRMIRVGNPDHIHESVRCVSLEELVETNANNKVEDLKKKHLSRIKDIEKELSQCDTQITNLRFTNRLKEIPTVEFKISHLLKELTASKASEEISAKREVSEASKKQLKYDLIKNVDVVLTTLNSCQKHPLDALFNGQNPDLTFHCVIVDEASQCCEPELLMPLRYKISKMILIGDPMQLPATVISRYAQEFDFGRSLFERFFIHFGYYNSASPIAMLTEQYRMHPEICSFPSRTFYDNRLVSANKTVKSYPLRPYIMFDLMHSSESKKNGPSIENEVEANFVRNLLVAVTLKVPENSKIGVITPYKGQKRLITNKIRNLQSERNITIEVNTCDGFQGQEKDVIILSCVRANDSYASVGFLKSTQRINVALTRAKHSLFVCISAKSLCKDKTWYSLIEDARERQCINIWRSTPSTNEITNIIVNKNRPQPAPQPQTTQPNVPTLPVTTKLVRTNGGVKPGLGVEPEFVMPMDID